MDLLSRRIAFVETTPKNVLASLDNQSPKRPIATVGLIQKVSDAAKSLRHHHHHLQLVWGEPFRIGPGLANLGNTCFLNSVLQSLTYTPPLATYLLTRTHSKSCKKNQFCALCEMETHVVRCFSGTEQSRVIAPKAIVSRLKSIAKHLRVGRQEDSHEFLRYFVDSLQSSCLTGNPKHDATIKDHTIINQIFGGKTQSQVLCLRCKHPSNTLEPCLDFSLEIRRSDSLEKAFAHFTKSELLTDDNRYRCLRCKTLVDAKKKLSISTAPAVMVVHFKRFEFGIGSGKKLDRHVSYPLQLNIGPYMDSSKGKVLYNLTTVLVHSGHSIHSGHYYSYVRAPNGVWYNMNDSDVRPVGEKVVLNQRAYMLFYTAASMPASEAVEAVVGERRASLVEKLNRQSHSVSSAVPSAVKKKMDGRPDVGDSAVKLKTVQANGIASCASPAKVGHVNGNAPSPVPTSVKKVVDGQRPEASPIKLKQTQANGTSVSLQRQRSESDGGSPIGVKRLAPDEQDEEDPEGAEGEDGEGKKKKKRKRNKKNKAAAEDDILNLQGADFALLPTRKVEAVTPATKGVPPAPSSASAATSTPERPGSRKVVDGETASSSPPPPPRATDKWTVSRIDKVRSQIFSNSNETAGNSPTPAKTPSARPQNGAPTTIKKNVQPFLGTNSIVPNVSMWEDDDESHMLVQKRDTMMTAVDASAIKQKRPALHDIEYEQGKKKKLKSARNGRPFGSQPAQKFFGRVGDGGDGDDGKQRHGQNQKWRGGGGGVRVGKEW